MTEVQRQAFLELDLVSIEKESTQDDDEANQLMQTAVAAWQQEGAGHGHGTVLTTLLAGLSGLSHPFRRDAINYFEQYTKVDRPFMQALRHGSDSSSKLKPLEKFMGNYGITRNFKGSVKANPDKYLPVIERLEATDVSNFDNVADRVLDFEQQLHTAYGGKRKLSAASKILWAFSPDLSIIIDSWTAHALGIKTHPSTYASYVKLWLDGYSAAKEQIAEACGDLPAKGEIKFATSTDWFRKRVFDWHLMRRGDRWSQRSSSANL